MGKYVGAYGYQIVNANAFGETYYVPNLVK